MIYSTYLATCRQLDVPRYLMLYYQWVSAAFSMIIVRNHSEASHRLSRFQHSEARVITSILFVFRVISRPVSRRLTIC